MSEKKALKREVKAVWDRVKRLRTESGKRYGPDEVVTAAEQLELSATRLRALAEQLSALSAMPPDARPKKPSKPKKPTAKRAKKRPAAND